MGATITQPGKSGRSPGGHDRGASDGGPQRLALQRLEVPIGGLACAGAAAPLAARIEQIRGVREATVNPVTERAVVVFDPGVTGVEQLVSAIEAQGVEVGRSRARWRLRVDGLTGMSRIRRLEMAVEQVRGVHAALVNPAASILTVEYTPRQTDVAAVREVVASEGFEVEWPPASHDPLREEPEDDPRRNELRLLWLRFWFAGAIAVPTLLLSHPSVIGMRAVLPPGSVGWRAVWGALSVLTMLAVLFSGVDIYRDAWAAFKRHAVDANSLITIAVTVAWLYSTAVVVAPDLVAAAARDILFFDVSAAVVALVSLGHALETKARRRSRLVVERLQHSQPRTARVIRDGPERVVTVEELAVGDVIVVHPWERIPADGTVLAGASTVDEAELTGGGPAQEKRRCDPVMAGTTNGPGAFSFRATQVGKDTVLSQVAHMIDDAQASRTGIGRGVATLSEYLVPAVIILAILGFLAWYTFGPAPQAPYALSVFLTTLILASCGALGLAAAMPLEVAIGSAADRGIVFASGSVVGGSTGVDTILIDESAVTEHALSAISELKKMGHEVLMLSLGAADATAARRATELGMDGVVPGGASGTEHALRLREEGRRIAVIGSPPFGSSASIPADVSATIGVTGQLGIGAADITVLRRSLSAVASALRLSRSATRAVAQNLVGTTAYYVLGLPLALGALSVATGPRLAPLIAALAMAGLWIAVVGNAARLRLLVQDCE